MSMTMDSYSNRMNTMFYHFTWALVSTFVANQVMARLLLPPATPKATLVPGVANGLVPNSHFRADQLQLDFDEFSLDASSEWNWNSSYVYAYVTANYSTPMHPRNEVIVWDEIMGGGALKGKATDLVVESDSHPARYLLRDIGKNLRSRQVELRVRYNSAPIAGWLFEEDVLAGVKFTVPDEYQRKVDGKKKGGKGKQ